MDTIPQVVFICDLNLIEMLIAELATIGYDSFQETEDGFISFNEQDIDKHLLDLIIFKYQKQGEVSYTIEKIVKENWNAKWEASYQPIIIGNECLVRASFHQPQPEYKIELIINPKMSFGTGHHETTSLMMEAQLNIDHKNKSVLDAGCGTGILSILAGKLGAVKITAFDKDEGLYDNIQENFIINDANGEILIGTVNSINFSMVYDIILANINKNILLNDIPHYVDLLKSNGRLLLSGFYLNELAEIEDGAALSGLFLVRSASRNNWSMAEFQAEI